MLKYMYVHSAIKREISTSGTYKFYSKFGLFSILNSKHFYFFKRNCEKRKSSENKKNHIPDDDRNMSYNMFVEN